MKRILIVIQLVIMTLILVSCSSDDKKVISEPLNSDISKINKVDYKVIENKSIYKDDTDTVENIYVTVPKNNKKSLADLNNYRFDRADITIKSPSLDIIFSTSKMLQAVQSDEKTNAQISTRGHGAAMVTQKSFKIKLGNNGHLWNGQNVINLNKHPNDLTRVRNKLSFDLFKLFEDSFSLRTKFCHLFIMDLNDTSQKDFIDYGLFTHVEQPNKDYFRQHSIFETGFAYKAEFFEFLEQKDILKNVDDPTYDKNKFEQVLSIQGLEEHSRLVKMLKDVNDENMNINDVIETHFDRNNYITWLALNLLMGNLDTNSQNFLFVSPTTSTKWYFIPWDYDYAWGYTSQPGVKKEATWQGEPISNYWGVSLHRRFFKDSNNIKDLLAKVDELMKTLTKERISERLQTYRQLTEPIVKSIPDVKFLPATLDNYNAEFNRIASTVNDNKVALINNLQKPMPIFLDDPITKNGETIFTWGKSYDFQGDSIFYEFKLSKTPNMSDIVVHTKQLIRNEYLIKDIAASTYYMTIEITDINGNKQVPFDCIDEGGNEVYYGVKKVIIQ